MLQFRTLIFCLAIVCSESALAETTQPLKPVSKSTAYTWSVGATLAPIAVGSGLLYASLGTGSDNFVVWGLCVSSAGLVFGPGTGHLYAEHPYRSWTGTVIRVAGGGMIGLGIATVEPFGYDNAGLSLMLLLGGSLSILISAIHDIATVGRSVDEYYEEHLLSNVRVQPRYFAKQKAIGLTLSMEF